MDERLRNLERRFKESGDPTHELAYLQEQVRQGGSLDWESYQRLAELDVDGAAGYLLARVERGDLEQEKLELAAYCSHEPARVALGAEAPEVPEDLEEWGQRFQPRGHEAIVRAALALARLALPLWESNSIDPLPREAVVAVEEWLAAESRTEAATKAANVGYLAGRAAVAREGHGSLRFVPDGWAACVCAFAANAAGCLSREAAIDELTNAVSLAAKHLVERAKPYTQQALVAWSLMA
jgi:hypothetical protein